MTAVQDAIFYGGLVCLFALRFLLVRRWLKKNQPDPLAAKFRDMKEWSK